MDQQELESRQTCGDIAVVGLACQYPGSRGPLELWENILACRRQFRRLPEKRLGKNYINKNRSVADKTYCDRAAVIDGFEFDAEEYRIPKAMARSTDVVQWLALQVAADAVRDAGLAIDEIRDRAGVVLGNTLTGDQTRSNSMRLRWPFVQSALELAAEKQGLASADRRSLAITMEDIYKSVFAPVNEDTLAGGLSNTIAGRICNHFDFHGGGYTVDGACASSLLAVCTAADALAQGRLDVALAGGVDISLDPFELVGFSKVGAIATDEMRVYDRRGDGFLPGEGCGFVVLKRLADARSAGDHVYAVIRGWGISSDGKGSITAPTANGQRMALQRAYDRANYQIDSLDFIEGHGTGTRVGDRIEIEAIGSALDPKSGNSERSIGLTSLKSLIGHTKAAAGVAALIKAVLAVNRRVLPPTCGCQQPHPSFYESTQELYPLQRGRVLPHGEKIRAGVSAMGFGGINTHVTLESGDSVVEKYIPRISERTLLASSQDAEVFVFGDNSWKNLQARLSKLAFQAGDLSDAELTDLAASLASDVPDNARVRAAVITSRPAELVLALRELAEKISQIRDGQSQILEGEDASWFLGCAKSTPRIGFLFPGQGSQQLQMGYGLIERYPWARELLSEAQQVWQTAGLHSLTTDLFRDPSRALDPAVGQSWSKKISNTEFAQPSICLVADLYGQLLQTLGIRPTAVTGHSLGELVALKYAGAYDQSMLWKLSVLRGQAMNLASVELGAMASLRCGMEESKSLIFGSPDLVIANLNSPRQTIVSGSEEAINRIIEQAKSIGIAARKLPVNQAFHHPKMRLAAAQFQKRLPTELGVVELNDSMFVSTMGQCKTTKPIDLSAHLTEQITASVDFIEAANRMKENCDVLLEVGPGRVLTDLVRETTANSIPCFPVASRPNHDRDLLTGLTACFVRGLDVNWPLLYEQRLVRPMRFANHRNFIENPCEQLNSVSLDFDQTTVEADLLTESPTAVNGATTVANVKQAVNKESATSSEASEPLQYLIDLAIERTGFSTNRVLADSRLLDNLNLDSIKAAELVSAVAVYFGVAGELDPAEFANNSLRDIAFAIQTKVANRSEDLGSGQTVETASGKKSHGAGDIQRYPTWVRDFVIEYE